MTELRAKHPRHFRLFARLADSYNVQLCCAVCTICPAHSLAHSLQEEEKRMKPRRRRRREEDLRGEEKGKKEERRRGGGTEGAESDCNRGSPSRVQGDTIVRKGWSWRTGRLGKVQHDAWSGHKDHKAFPWAQLHSQWGGKPLLHWKNATNTYRP